MAPTSMKLAGLGRRSTRPTHGDDLIARPIGIYNSSRILWDYLGKAAVLIFLLAPVFPVRDIVPVGRKIQ